MEATQTETPRLTPLKYGTLPTRSFLASRLGAGRKPGVDEHLAALRCLMSAGNELGALRMLNALGFDWLPSKATCPTCGVVGECMCADVEAVRHEMPEDCAVCASLQLQLEQTRARLESAVWYCRSPGCLEIVREDGVRCLACAAEVSE